jgi:hypothetical protein
VTTARLSAYLALERQMLALDALGDPIAEMLRDAMDSLWYELSEEEHQVLDNRTVQFPGESFLTFGKDLFEDVVEQPVIKIRQGPISVTDWECAAA